MTERVYNVLFLCTGNSARSVFGEFLLRAMDTRFETSSAGAAPTGEVHPLTLRVLEEDFGIDVRAARSKSWNEMLASDPDLVITVCDGAREACPRFSGGTVQVHWSLPDPAAVTGSTAERLLAFRLLCRPAKSWASSHAAEEHIIYGEEPSSQPEDQFAF